MSTFPATLDTNMQAKSFTTDNGERDRIIKLANGDVINVLET